MLQLIQDNMLCRQSVHLILPIHFHDFPVIAKQTIMWCYACDALQSIKYNSIYNIQAVHCTRTARVWVHVYMCVHVHMHVSSWCSTNLDTSLALLLKICEYSFIMSSNALWWMKCKQYWLLPEYTKQPLLIYWSIRYRIHSYKLQHIYNTAMQDNWLRGLYTFVYMQIRPCNSWITNAVTQMHADSSVNLHVWVVQLMHVQHIRIT